MLLIFSNDVELNPGPKKDSTNRNFSIVHWNLNSIAAQNLVKLSHLEVYNIIHSCDLICLPETWFDSTTSIDSNYLALKGYSSHCVDHPDNIKQTGVCVYHKENLAVTLDQRFVSEITFENKKKGHVIFLYKSLSQTQDQFDNFLQLFEELLQYIFKPTGSFVLITGDFSRRNYKRYLGYPVSSGKCSYLAHFFIGTKEI